MNRIHLSHVLPGHVSLHQMIGYKDVIDGVHWGLEQLGYAVTYGVNYVDNDCRNIMFGAQVLPIDVLRTFREDTIIYNLDQIPLDVSALRQETVFNASKFQMWDYSESNLALLSGVKNRYPVKLVPIGYAPNLTRIRHDLPQEIDVLIYGTATKGRLQVFHDLAEAGLRCVFLAGLYGEPRDDLIGRSKIVLNLTKIEFHKIFEIVRVSFLLANRKAVVSDCDSEAFVEEGVAYAVCLVNASDTVAKCFELLRDDAARHALEQRGFDYIQTRDVRTYLRNALA